VNLLVRRPSPLGGAVIPVVWGQRLRAGLLVAAVLAPFSAAWAADPIEGKRLYEMRCLGCHGDDHRAGTIGPSLTGIFGRKAASGEGGVHSRVLIESGIRWDDASLRKFLAAPMKELPGTNMPVAVPNPQQLDDLLAYLHVLQ